MREQICSLTELHCYSGTLRIAFGFNNRTNCSTIAAAWGKCGSEQVSRGQICIFGDGPARLPSWIQRSCFFCWILVAVLILVPVSTPSFASVDEAWPFVGGLYFDGHSAERGLANIGPKQAYLCCGSAIWDRDILLLLQSQIAFTGRLKI
jgi:hypothetical protein